MNRESYFDYDGEMPPGKLWCPEQMSYEKRSHFETWYNDQVKTGYHFNFKKELIDYCQKIPQPIARRAFTGSSMRN